MMYSRWVPDKGTYEHFNVPGERRGMGDDLPVPRLRARSPIGIASTDAGRPLPAGAKPAGSGSVPKGCIVPSDRSVLSGGDVANQLQAAGWVIAGILGLAVGYYLRGSSR